MNYRIEQDTDTMSPAEWGDDSLFLVANHRQFFVPESGQKTIPKDPDELRAKYGKTHWVFPLEAYIHSGVSLALSGEGNFPDRQWDVSQVGFVFASKKQWRLSKAARKAALSLVGTWNQYLSGDVWGYVIETDTGKEVDSCWGFYGREHAEEEAKAALVHAQADEAKEAKESAEWAARDVPTVG